MAAPTATGTGNAGNMVIHEMEWTLPKTAKGITAKGTTAKGVAAKGVAAKGVAAQGVTAQSIAAQAKLAAIPGLEWELPETAVTKLGGAKGVAVTKATGAAVQGGAAANGATAAGAKTVANAGNLAATGTGVTTAAQVSSGSGTIWSGTGMKLGWGLGLGAWGPILLLGTVAAVGVGVYSYMKSRAAGGELEEITT